MVSDVDRVLMHRPFSVVTIKLLADQCDVCFVILSCLSYNEIQLAT